MEDVAFALLQRWKRPMLTLTNVDPIFTRQRWRSGSSVVPVVGWCHGATTGVGPFLSWNEREHHRGVLGKEREARTFTDHVIFPFLTITISWLSSDMSATPESVVSVYRSTIKAIRTKRMASTSNSQTTPTTASPTQHATFAPRLASTLWQLHDVLKDTIEKHRNEIQGIFQADAFC